MNDEHPLQGDPELDQRLAAVGVRARRRWLIAMGAVIVAVAVAVPLLNPLLDGRRAHRPVAHHTGGTSWVAVVVPIVILLVGIAVVTWMLTRRRGVFAPPLTGGLPRASRRQVGRTVRRGGPPSNDRLTRAVEVHTAQRVASHARFGYAVFGVLLLLSVLQATFAARTTAATVYFTAAAVLFAGFLVVQVVTTRGARRYLEHLPADDRSATT